MSTFRLAAPVVLPPPNTLVEVLCTGVGESLGLGLVFDDELEEPVFGIVVVVPELMMSVLSPEPATAAAEEVVLLIVGALVVVLRREHTHRRQSVLHTEEK